MTAFTAMHIRSREKLNISNTLNVNVLTIDSRTFILPTIVCCASLISYCSTINAYIFPSLSKDTNWLYFDQSTPPPYTHLLLSTYSCSSSSYPNPYLGRRALVIRRVPRVFSLLLKVSLVPMDLIWYNALT